MSNDAMLPSSLLSVTYCRKACSDLLEYATANREDGIFNDVTIQVGHLRISANRLVLSCYSTFFEKMFKSNMKERCQTSIEIKQLEAKAVQCLINYMYKGNITIDRSNVCDILVAADFLLLDEPKSFCLKFLKNNISLESWYTALSVATLYSCDQLKEHTFQFINDNLNEIIQSAGFKTFTKDDLSSLILSLQKSKKAISNNVQSRLIIGWVKSNEEERKAVFAELFLTIDLEKMSFQILQDLLTETLIKNNVDCLDAVMSELFKFFEIRAKNRKQSIESTKIICLGGKETGNRVIEVFNVNNTTMKSYPNLLFDLRNHCSLKLNNAIFCIGGLKLYDYRNVYDKVCQMKLEEANWRWEEVNPMNEKRSRMGAAVFNDSLVVTGGWNDTGTLSSTEHCNDPTDKWQLGPNLRQKRCGNALVRCNDSLFTLGGFSEGTCLSSIERLDSFGGEWENVAHMSIPRNELAAVSLDGYIYAIGGRRDGNLKSAQNTVERFDPNLNKWSYVCSMKHGRCCHSACVLKGKIFVIGGKDTYENVIKEIEIYDPKKNKWSVLRSSENLNYSLYHTAALSI